MDENYVEFAMKHLFRSAEQALFHAILAKHMQTGSVPLLLQGGTGIGKTRAYLHAAATLAQTGKKIAIAVPTWRLADQLLNSEDLSLTRRDLSVGVYLPRTRFNKKNDYEAHRVNAMASDLMIVTHANVLIDHYTNGAYSGATTRDYLIFDEAHKLLDASALRLDLTISAADIASLGVHPGSPIETARAIHTSSSASREQRAIAHVFLKQVDREGGSVFGFNEDRDLCLFHRHPARILKSVANRAQTAFLSATLTNGGSFDRFRWELGISNAEQHNVEPTKHGEVDFIFKRLKVESEAWRLEIFKAIRQASRPCLVLVPSHALAQSLCAGLAPDDGLHISASDWAGMDDPRQWRSLIIPRVPFAPPTHIEGSQVSVFPKIAADAAALMKQAIGRVLRRAESRATIHILDARAARLPAFVPARFMSAWASAQHEQNSPAFREGHRKTVALSKPIRSPALRLAAFAKHGRRCCVCSFTTDINEQLQVHHLHEVSQGERQTRVDDVIVLCCNCHQIPHAKESEGLTKFLRVRPDLRWLRGEDRSRRFL